MEIISAVQVKVSFNEDLRRFSILRDASFKQLSENILSICNIDPNVPLVIKYVDVDRDLITMSSDAELQEALKTLPQEAILRLNVMIKPLIAPPAFVPTSLNPSAPSLEGELEDLSLRDGAQQFHPHMHGMHRGGFHHGGPPPFRGHHGGGFGFGPYRGGFPHHHRHPHPYEFQHPAHAAASPPPGFTDEERKQWKEAQKEHWKNARRAWKENWKNESKGDREAMKMHKKEMKRCFKEEKEEKMAKREGVKYVARHVKDVTITDGTELMPGTPFLKTWKLRNDGAEAWPAGCRLLFISRKGDRMGGPESVNVEGAVAPGQEVDVSINLVAPNEPGRYTSYYKLITAEGIKFGQRLWVSIIVAGSSSSSSSSSEDDESRFGPVADMVEAMGFDVKRKHIIRLLVKHDNNVDKVVQILTKKDKGCKKDKKDKKDKKKDQ